MTQNNLKKYREKRKLSLRQFCAVAGINAYQEYMKIEHGETLPRVDKALRIAKVLKTSVEKLWIIK